MVTSLHLSSAHSCCFGIHDIVFIVLSGCLSSHVLWCDDDPTVLIYPYLRAGILLLIFHPYIRRVWRWFCSIYSLCNFFVEAAVWGEILLLLV